MLPAPLLLVEDQAMMHIRLRSILEEMGYSRDALSFATTIADARRLIEEQPFAMALIDVGLPDGNGIDLIEFLHGRDPALPILVISAWSDEHIIMRALRSGATGYLLKERDDIEIKLSIRSVLRGGAPIDPFVARHILSTFGSLAAAAPGGALAHVPQSVLSPREVEILNLVSKGLTNKEIAEIVSLSRFTVECHVRNIYKKLAVRSRTEAIFEARARGFLP
ncbi:DNA-binding NarL/FixJ family response regulator [Sphingopyxis sp. OAS728]|uniref:LuxR C-terminal-related transcriptional regulator n=1 Tax=Sphingopyxis sp. OAS728 TaxID=2663823 RepID=UPI00178A388C|nr:response regulator transcription factor [Sphingopyxis sp. OAS728]MBE1527139.1 DNA-binding NarL/FixJ family response regulator [Sphingopyxis sp. OAS728]